MRFLLTVALALASMASLSFCWVGSQHEQAIAVQELISYRVPRVPDEFNRKITWPRKQIGTGPQEFETDDGPTTYRANHKAAWLECLECFYTDAKFDGEPLWKTTESGWVTISGPDHWNAARLDGWHECQSQLNSLLLNYSPAELRAAIKRDLMESQVSTVTRFAVVGIVLGMLAACSALLHSQRRAEP
ncbi:hypothetical protein NZK35_12130 [Stieleria sp. ICT_E10.1]|uniref:hypothetical protein n=1 Tax=Stieleria sedimenti TaxID=2976331 RepID=UPI0021807406|nr:hypothetical protein [Stieleria sedimenti]MCS7467393.1 hypothetical protein [Stieleria sedimenti]